MNDEVSANAIIKRATKHYIVVIQPIAARRKLHYVSKAGQCIIVHPDSVLNIAFYHALYMEVVTVCNSSDKDCDLCSLFRLPRIHIIQL